MALYGENQLCTERVVNFNTPLQLGIGVVPPNFRFIRDLRHFMVDVDVSAGDSTIDIVSADPTGLTIDLSSIPFGQYIAYDLDGNVIRNMVMGPSTEDIYKGIRKTIAANYSDADTIQVRDDSGTPGGAIALIGQDSTVDPPIVGDSVFLKTLPLNWDLYSSATVLDRNPALTGFTTREADLFVKHHAKAMSIYSVAGGTHYIQSDYFGQNIIDNSKKIGPYNLSFYYKSKGDITVTPTILGFQNANNPTIRLGTATTPLNLTNNDTNADKWRYYSGQFEINTDLVDVIKFVFNISFNAGSTAIYLAYPMITHANSFGVGGILEADIVGNSITINEITETTKTIKADGGTDYFSTDIDNIINPIGLPKKFFKFNMEVAITSSSDWEAFTMLQQMNRRGYNIVARPFFKYLPPVMVGNLILTGNMPSFDTDIVNIEVEFIETQ